MRRHKPVELDRTYTAAGPVLEAGEPFTPRARDAFPPEELEARIEAIIARVEVEEPASQRAEQEKYYHLRRPRKPGG